MSVLVGDSQCFSCRRFVSGIRSPSGKASCAAFADGIPREIFFMGADHRKPYAGDNGIRWESNGDPYPEDELDP